METDSAVRLSEDDRRAIRRLGYPETPELLEAALPYLERDRDLALVAAEGSGRVLLYGLAAGARCDPDSAELQALILCPTREAAVRAGRASYELAGPRGLYSLAWPRQPGTAETPAPVAQVVAGRPRKLLSAVEAGRLSLSSLRLLALDGVEALGDADRWDAVRDLLDTLPEEVRVIAAAESRSERFDRLVDRQLHRPKRWPRAVFDDTLEAPTGDPLHVAEAATEHGRFDRLEDVLRGLVPDEEGQEIFVVCPGEEAAQHAAASLAARGFRLSAEPGEPGVAVVWGEEEEPAGDVAVRVGLPSGLPGLRRELGGSSRRAAVIAPRERPQLELLARRAGWPTETLPEPTPEEIGDPIAEYRSRVAGRVRDVDPAESLLLEPLFEVHGAPAVAAALSRWVRELRAGRPEPEEPSAPEPAAGRPPRRRERKQPAGGWTRLFIKVGDRDGAGPGDLVGAITGETDAVGGQIGKIEIEDSYSIVEVDPELADHIIEELSGTYIRGREVLVRRDVKG